MLPVADLPPELKTKLVEYLSARDILHLSCVSKGTYDNGFYELFKIRTGQTDESVGEIELLMKRISLAPEKDLMKQFGSNWSKGEVGVLLRNLYGEKPLTSRPSKTQEDCCRLLLSVRKARTSKDASNGHLSNDALLFLKSFETMNAELIKQAYEAIPERVEVDGNGVRSMQSDVFKMLFAKACWALCTLPPLEGPLQQETLAKIRRSQILWECVRGDFEQLPPPPHRQPFNVGLAAALEEYYRFIQQIRGPEGIKRAYSTWSGEVEEAPEGLYKSLVALEDGVRDRNMEIIRESYELLLTNYLPEYAPAVLCMFNRLYATTKLYFSVYHTMSITPGDVEGYFIDRSRELRRALGQLHIVSATLLEMSPMLYVEKENTIAGYFNFVLCKASEQLANSPISEPA